MVQGQHARKHSTSIQEGATMKKEQVKGEETHPLCPGCKSSFTYEYSNVPKKFHCIHCGIDFRSESN